MKTKYIVIAAAVSLGMGFTSCNEDKLIFPDIEETPQVSAKVVESSLAEGAVVKAEDVAQISLAYDGGIQLNPSSSVTLNGSHVYAEVQGRMVVVNVNLEPGTSYTLEVPADAVIANKGYAYAEAFKLQFVTESASARDNAYLATLSNPDASLQAKNVLNFLIEQNGKRILSGGMANVDINNDFNNWMYSVSYAYPALAGYDFINLNADWTDATDISAPLDQWKNNGLVSYMWHWCVPTDKAAYDAKDLERYGFNVPGGDNPTEFDIREALKPGTWQNECIIKDIDKVAGVFKKLQDAGVPVIFRPLHEAAGSYEYNNPWFWWGRHGQDATKELWKLMYDRLVRHHGLNNLLWVWTAQYSAGHEAELLAGYPGNDYVDMVGVDLYEQTDEARPENYKGALALTEGKRLVSLSEVGMLEDPADCIAKGADWAWFMLWYTHNIHQQGFVTDSFGNTPEAIRAVMQSPFVINREQMPSLK